MSLKIVFLSRMPLAGAPWETMKCLRKYANLNVRWICECDRYPDGRVFPSDLVYGKGREDHLKLIEEADIVHIQTDHFLSDDSILMGKKVLIQFHSCPKRGTYEMYKKYNAQYYTIRQPMQIREYSGIPSLPTLLDPEEYTPSGETHEVPVVVFAPSVNWEVNIKGSKAKRLVNLALNETKGIKVDSFMGVPYLENLKRKKQADILIDDVVGDTFHKTTLEGCCFGLAVITSWRSPGMVYSKLDSLSDTLRDLIENRSVLEDSKRKSREWMVNEWHPKDLVKNYLDAYEGLMNGKLNNTLCSLAEIS